MKRLTLIRHAKSSWQEAGLDDFQRPLNKRGERDAPRMGERLARAGERPDRIASSAAQRAVRTARLIARALGLEPQDVVLDSSLYLASAEQLLAFVHELDDRLGHVALVAHNPGITHFVNLLCGTDIENVPTCGVARLRLRAERWSEAAWDGAELVDFDTPKRAS